MIQALLQGEDVMRTLSCLLIVLLLALVACTPDEVVPEKSVVSAPISITRVTSTPESIVATATAVPPPTITTLLATTTTTMPPATIFPTIRPTATLRSTVTPTAIATPLLTHYDLPTWLNDPEAAVLMTVARLEFNSKEDVIAFINVNSEEMFTIPAPPNLYSAEPAWGKDENGVYFEYPQNEAIPVASNTYNIIPQYIHRVYLATGEAIKLPPDTPPGVAQRSPNANYLTRIIHDREKGELTITIENPNTFHRTNLIDPFNGQFGSHTDVLWAPTNDFVAVRYYAFGERDEPPDVATVIYNLDGQIYRQNSDLLAWAWAPDNSYRLLYINGGGFGSYSPCIWEIQKNTSSCLSEVNSWTEENNVKAGSYEWSPDSQQIQFTYWGYTPRASGLCQIEIEDRVITCLIDESDLGEPDNYDPIHYIINYLGWSSNDQYLAFVTDYSSPGGDDASHFQIATVANDGSQFQTWGYGSEASWRPPINP